MRDRLGKVTGVEKPRWLSGGIGSTGQERGRSPRLHPRCSSLPQRRTSNIPPRLIPSSARKRSLELGCDISVILETAYDILRAKVVSIRFPRSIRVTRSVDLK